MNIQKMFFFGFACVVSMQSLQTCDLTAQPTYVRQSPMWAIDAMVDDVGAACSSDTVIIDPTKRNRQDAVEFEMQSKELNEAFKAAQVEVVPHGVEMVEKTKEEAQCLMCFYSISSSASAFKSVTVSSSKSAFKPVVKK